ncbi:MAG: EbsA family protein [Lactobacillaceae bacterium]|jgi:hypothetical protein|nr:EbsA family protein [Lactobacillaceae bacterium]
MKGYYQPAGVVGLVNWAWILMVGLAALIMQLEVTHFNVWTAVLLISFIALMLFTILRRKLMVDGNFVYLTQLFSSTRLSVHIDEIEHAQFTRRGLIFDYNGDSYNVVLSSKVRNAIKEKLGE